MNKLLQNYAILKSNWVPSNPIDTFLPFFTFYLMKNKPDSIGEKDLSSRFSEFMGFNIPFHLMDNLLTFLANNDCIKRNKKCIMIDYDSISIYNTLEDDNSVLMNIKSLYQDFSKKNESINYQEFERALLRFVEKYDNYIFVNDQYLDIEYDESETEELSNNDILDFLFLEYVKDLQKSSNPLYNVVENICQGSLIKGYLSYEIPENVEWFSDKVIFLDTPVVLRMLGYCNDYYKKDYILLYENLLKQQIELKIFDITYDEIYTLLQSAEQWIESSEFSIIKATDISMYFKFNGFSRQDVLEEISNLKENLKKMKIEVVKTSFESEELWGLVEKYREEIQDKYSKSVYYYKKIEKTIDHDARALAYFKKYYSEKFVDFQQIKYMFITSNSKLIDIFKQNCNGVSPIIKDSILGMMICGNDLISTSEMGEIKLLSFCYNAFKPSQRNKEKYIETLNEARDNGIITESMFVYMKNYNLIPEKIMLVTKGNCYDFDSECLLDIISDVKKESMPEIIEQYEKQLDNERLEYEKEKFEFVKEDYNKYNNGLLIVKLLLSVMFIVATIITSLNIIKNTHIIFKISLGFIAFINIISTTLFLIKKFDIVYFIENKILTRKLEKLLLKYKLDVSVDDFFQVKGSRKIKDCISNDK